MAYKALLPTLAEATATKALAFARPKILSNQLRRSIYKQQNARGPASWALIVPQFWATYIHNGRGPVTPNTAKILVWFRNPKNDPRLFNGNSPISRSQVVKMTKAQFDYWAGENRKKIQAFKKATGKRVLTSSEIQSLKLPMVVAKVSGPSRLKGTKVYPFFSNAPGGGMAGFKEQVVRDIKTAVPAHIRLSLSDAGLVGYKKKITLNI